MVTRQLPLHDNIYSSRLHAELWKLQADTAYDPAFIRLLLDILRIDLMTVDMKTLNDHYPDGLLKQIIGLDIEKLTNNTELIARVLDIKIISSRAYIKSSIKPAVANYVKVFDLTESHSFLIRALALVQMGRQLFTQEIPELLKKSIKIVTELPYPYWQHRLVAQMALTFGKATVQKATEAPLKDRLQELFLMQDMMGALQCVDSLNAIGSISDYDSATRKAMLFEQEADNIIAERQPNTFYPKVSILLNSALAIIKDLPNCQELKSRVIQKLQEAQLDDIRMVSAAGAKVSPDIDIQHLLSVVTAMDIKSFAEAIQILLSLPIPSIGYISTQTEDREPSLLDQLFSKHVRLSSQGKPVGSSDGADARDNQIRMILREHMIVLIKMIKDVMDIYGTPDLKQVFELLYELKSPFVPSERASLYTMGLRAGFNGDFIVAAHLLIPQWEYSFRHIAKTHGISVTNYGNTEEQRENTLGGTLKKMTGIINDDLLAEVENFLLDGSSANFRNELLHGLTSPKLIEHYGYYAWWLSLKLIYQTKELFRMKE